jgi:hypothetical protein
MSAARAGAALRPAAIGGFLLLVLGAALLATGGGMFLGNPTYVDLWLVGIGLLVLLGAMVGTLLRTPVPARIPEPVPMAHAAPTSRARPVTPARIVAPTPPARPVAPAPTVAAAATMMTEEPPARPSAPAPPADPVSRPLVASTIAAQYALVDPPPAAWDSAEETPAWDEGEFVSLPFSAGPRLADHGGWTLDTPVPNPPYAPLGFLEREVERLRARVRELEAPPPTRWAPPPQPASTNAPANSSSPSEPPRPSFDRGPRACTGCGSGLPGDATDPLCWGCGRPLCATCYWRTKEGAGAHTCPTCFARTGGAALSGGHRLVSATAEPERVRLTATPPR